MAGATEGDAAPPHAVTTSTSTPRGPHGRSRIPRVTLSIHFPLPNAEERAVIMGYCGRQLGTEQRKHLASLSEGRSGRELEDACGVAERLWASDLVSRGQRSEITVPPLEQYVEAFQLKFAGRLPAGPGAD